MFCINSEGMYNGKYRVIIQADTTPETMPVTGEGVAGADSNMAFASGSILYVVQTGETYFLGEPDGESAQEWIKWGGGAEEKEDTEGEEGGEG